MDDTNEEWVPVFGEPQNVYRRLDEYDFGDNTWYVAKREIYGWSLAEDTALEWARDTGRVFRLLAFNGKGEQLMTEDAIYFQGRKYLSADECEVD